MDYYYCNCPSRVKTKTMKIHHIVDEIPIENKSTYYPRIVNGRPTDSFYFSPAKDELKYQHQASRSFIIPGTNGEAIREIHTTVYSPQKFNENGIIREKCNYLLYENKNWTENIGYPIVEYEKIKIPKPKPKAKPKPKPKPIPTPKPKIEKEFEIVNEEIEREEDREKVNLKSNYIRKSDKIKNKKYKYKKSNYDKRNYIKEKDNNYENEDIINIYDFHNNNDKDNDNDNDDKGSEIKKIKKITEQKKIIGEFNDIITTKKEYKLHKTSMIKVPVEK